MRALVFLCVLNAPLVAVAQTDDQTKCNDGYADCHDSCSLRHGLVTRDSERIKLSKCIDKCKRVQSECLEQFFETKNNALSDGALKKQERDDDLREDNRKRAIVPDEKPAKKTRDPAEEQPKRTATRADELNKDEKKKSESGASDPRYDMKFEEEKKPEPKKEEKREETARAEEPKPAPEKKKSSSDEEPKKKKKERALDEWDPEAL